MNKLKAYLLETMVYTPGSPEAGEKAGNDYKLDQRNKKNKRYKKNLTAAGKIAASVAGAGAVGYSAKKLYNLIKNRKKKSVFGKIKSRVKKLMR